MWLAIFIQSPRDSASREMRFPCWTFLSSLLANFVARVFNSLFTLHFTLHSSCVTQKKLIRSHIVHFSHPLSLYRICTHWRRECSRNSKLIRPFSLLHCESLSFHEITHKIIFHWFFSLPCFSSDSGLWWLIFGCSNNLLSTFEVWSVMRGWKI